MPIQFVQVAEADLSGGIDARSSENMIPQGYSQDLVNTETIERRLRKRKGYQGFAGGVPVRVSRVDYLAQATNNICFTLDTSIDLLSLRSSPIVVYGRTSTAEPGDFSTTDSAHYYPLLEAEIRKTLAVGTHTLTISATEHEQGTNQLFVGTVESTNLATLDYTSFLPDSIDIEQSTSTIEIDYTNGTSSAKSAFVYYLGRDPVAGSVYNTGNWSVGSPATVTHSIPASSHGLNNFNIIAQVYRVLAAEPGPFPPADAAEYELVDADSVVIQTSGQVDITITNDTTDPLFPFLPTPQTYFAILSAADPSQFISGVLPALTTQSIQIPALVSPFLFLGIYLEQTPGGAVEMLLPDSFSYSSATNSLTLTLTNSSLSNRNLKVFYEYGQIRSNQLCVTGADISLSSTSSYTDLRPQLTIWGLDHSEIYGGARTAREGWVTHIDSYRRSAEERMISGLGGNLFSARTYEESGAQYDYGSLFPSLFGQASADARIGPLLHETGDSPGRTRGYVTATGSSTGFGVVSSVVYNSGTTWTDYTISLPGKAIFNSLGVPTSLSSVISTTSGLEDYLTVQGMSYARHEGEFLIRSIADGVGQIVVSVENASVTSSDYDDLGTAGLAGIFSDQVVFSATTHFIPGDTLVSSIFGTTIIPTVLSSLGSTIVIDGAVEMLTIAGGLVLTGKRTSRVVPLRLGRPTLSPSVVNFVRGDMLTYSEISRELRVLSVNTDTDRAVTFTADGTYVTVTLGSGETTPLLPGGRIMLLGAGIYSGVQQIFDILSISSFRFASTLTGPTTGTLLGKTIEIDEDLTWQDTLGDTNQFQVASRWIPVEAPDDNFDLTPSTYISHFRSNSYAEQPFLRSVMVADNLYLTNGDDELLKFDGTNIYRAGIFPWQPGLFLTQETSSTVTPENNGAMILNPSVDVTVSSIDAPGGVFTLTAASDSSNFAVGDRIQHAANKAIYLIGKIDSTLGKIYVTSSISTSSTTTISKTAIYRYYFRMNAVDANQNIIASAVTGSSDYEVALGAQGRPRLRLVGFPAWDIYDYDRLELQIYRTIANATTPFYLVTTLPISFDNQHGYIDFEDAFPDKALISTDEVALLKHDTANPPNIILATTWQEPLRAKYITSAGNSLVLGNIRDYPQLDYSISFTDSTVGDGDFHGKKLVLRRDEAGTGTVTDMQNTVVYEFIQNSLAIGVTKIIGGSSGFFNVFIPDPSPYSPGDWVYLYYPSIATSGRSLRYCGWFQVVSKGGGFLSFFIAQAITETITYGVGEFSLIHATNTKDIPIFLGNNFGNDPGTASPGAPDGNMGMVNGNNNLIAFQVARRLSLAVNASMRMVDRSIESSPGIFPFETFTPWVVARAGNEFSPGQIVLRQPKIESTTMAMVVPSLGSTITQFVNGVKRSAPNVVSASVQVFPSRILVSYENYPEIFDNPTATLAGESDSAIDINPADGQEITGIIPFFGDAAFGAAQQSGVVVVFKANSIYLIDITQKRAGANSIQKIESQGLGCTAPYTISSTKNGIVFANESGIYRLGRNLTIQYLGRFMERNWLQKVNRNQLAIMQGHHYSIGRQYKLSVPIGTDTESSQVYVYDHTAEDQIQSSFAAPSTGSWSRFDNHPSTGWANLAQDAYFASTTGRVFSIRRLGELSDYRDDSSAITATIVTRAMDMGSSGIRKILSYITSKYRVSGTNSGTSLYTSTDLSSDFTATTPIIIRVTTSGDGLSDISNKSVTTIRHSVNRDFRKGVYFQVKFENINYDEDFELAGFDMTVSGLSVAGIHQAAQSR